MQSRASISTGAHVVLSIALAITVLLVPFEGHSAPWDFGVTADLGIVYTDNLRLLPDGQEESDIVYTVSPTFSLSTDGDRLSADILYRPEAYFYQDAPESDQLYHVVDASLTATIVRDALFLYTSAVQYQTVESPGEVFPTSNLPITQARVDSTGYEIRPYWEQTLGFADVSAEVAYIETRYDSERPSFDLLSTNNKELSGSLNLNNFSRQQGFAWGLGYDHQRVEYESVEPWEYQRASANLGYWVSSSARFFVSGGAETSVEDIFESNLDEEFWETGFQYRPSQRLDLELAVGQRSYGDSYRLQASYQLRRGQTSLSYSEQPATRSQMESQRRPIIFTDSLDNILDRPGGTDRFLQKRGEWSIGIGLAKSNISFRVFSEERLQRTTATGEPLNNERYTGVAFRWSWQLSANSTLGFSADVANRAAFDTESDLQRAAIDLAYRLSQRLSLVLLAQNSVEEGVGSSIRDYTENQVRLMLRTEF